MWTRYKVTRIDIELTTFCNIKCSACTREVSGLTSILNTETLSFDTIKSRFRKEDFPNLQIINFCGSIDEPISHPEIYNIVDFFAEWKVHINISTNGSLRNESWWSELANKLSITSHSVIWGIDGIDETSEIYRTGSSFDKVRKNFRAFNQAGGRSIWQFIVFEHNKHQLPLLEDIAKQEGFKSTKIIYSTRDKTITVHKKTNTETVISPVQESKPEFETINCRYLNNGMLFINCFGYVVPCCYLNPYYLYNQAGMQKDDDYLRYMDDLSKFDGLTNTNIKNADIVDIIEGPFFNHVYDSWTSNPYKVCIKKCRENTTNLMLTKKI